jgi:hypothetical protein
MRGNRGYADLHEHLVTLQSRAMERGESYRQRRRKGIAPNTPTRTIEETRDDE